MRGRQSWCSLQVIFKAVSEVNVANQNLEPRVFSPSNQCFLQLLPGKMYFWIVFATVGGAFFAMATAFLATMSNVFARVEWVLLLVLLVLVLLSVLFLLPLLPLLPLPCPPLRPLQHHAEPSLIPYPSRPHQNNLQSTGAVSATGSSNNRNNRHNRLKRNNMKQAQQEQEEQPATYHILLTTYDLPPTAATATGQPLQKKHRQ